MNYGTTETIIAIIGLTVITFVTRSFFFLSQRELVLPDWVRRGLRYAPLAALAAVLVPEIVMTQGQLIGDWRDARLFAVAAATAYYVWRRGLLGTILAGMAVLLPLRIGLGWYALAPPPVRKLRASARSRATRFLQSGPR